MLSLMVEFSFTHKRKLPFLYFSVIFIDTNKRFSYSIYEKRKSISKKSKSVCKVGVDMIYLGRQSKRCRYKYRCFLLLAELVNAIAVTNVENLNID